MRKPPDSIACSHDKLFKETFSNLEHARSFLENYLPSDLLAVFNLDSLEICKGSFVEKSLKEYHSDLLYKIKTSSGQAYIYFLFEHKSYPDSLIHLQLLKYMIGIWRLGIKQNKSKKLDIIVPLVMYHGKNEWNTPPNFGGLFGDAFKDKTGGVQQRYIPDFHYLLFDLHHISDEEIRGTIVSRLVMLVFKHIFDPDFERKLPGILHLLKELAGKETGLQYIESLLRYLLSNVENMSGDKLKSLVADSITGKEGSIIMDYANSALGKEYHKGIQMGMQQGMIRGLRETAFDLIDVRFGHDPDAGHVKEIIKHIDNIDNLKEKIKTIASVSDLKTFLGH